MKRGRRSKAQEQKLIPPPLPLIVTLYTETQTPDVLPSSRRSSNDDISFTTYVGFITVPYRWPNYPLIIVVTLDPPAASHPLSLALVSESALVLCAVPTRTKSDMTNREAQKESRIVSQPYLPNYVPFSLFDVLDLLDVGLPIVVQFSLSSPDL
jgi:hypothetical protein